ncbi:helix-turn-helix domain-containing protein [Phytohabitans kaempferiae]|uniref:Helix-turn-helix domain-containing protein n=1 Tax=Phytohabitans kaempferiae TaxID=1620943 RepID=A0ABV6LZF5_9ACTN
MRDTRPLATPAEVAEHLQKPVRTLEQWRYLGIGPSFIRVGRDVRYRWRDIERWEDAQTTATTAVA